jgi:hypothetical protein
LAIATPRGGKISAQDSSAWWVIEIESLFSTARHMAIARGAQITVEIDTVAASIYVSAEGARLRDAKKSALITMSVSPPLARA